MSILTDKLGIKPVEYGDSISVYHTKDIEKLKSNYKELAEEMIDIGSWCGNWTGFEKTFEAIKETMERQLGEPWERIKELI